MILKKEIESHAEKNEVAKSTVDKDWVLGHFIDAIYSIPECREQLIFKGGTCLRKCYFPAYRFSEDLDFTCTNKDFELSRKTLNEIVKTITERTEMPLHISELKPLQHKDQLTGYKAIIKFWGADHPKNQTPPLQIKKDLHVPKGIESLTAYHIFTDFERALITGIDNTKIQESAEETIRVLRQIEVILRKKTLTDKLKKRYDNTCQICGIRLSIGPNKYYSEVHHIVPLGRPHNGKDTWSNMICVCPNHHVQLDLKAIPLTLKITKHEIAQESINYHNSFLISNG